MPVKNCSNAKGKTVKTNTMLEIAIEVAWQLEDVLNDFPRAEHRWQVASIASDIINKGLIDENTEDIDEVIDSYLGSIGL